MGEIKQEDVKKSGVQHFFKIAEMPYSHWSAQSKQILAAFLPTFSFEASLSN